MKKPEYDLDGIYRLYLECGENKAELARRLGVSRTWARELLSKAERKRNSVGDLRIPEDIGTSRPVEELIEERKRKFHYKQKIKDQTRLIPIQVKDDKPIGIWASGDPHIDDDGTDIIQLESHMNLVKRTDGLYAANIGDTTNNWVGRLAKLYAEQSTSAAEAWQLCEWFITELKDKWLFIIGGNHNCWSGASDPLKWITKCTPGIYASYEVRLELKFPSKQSIRINAHHEFVGQSQWNPAHGTMKAAHMGFRDHLLISGHKHISGYGILKCPATGVISHCVQIASYKVIDRYAEEKGFRDQHISPCVVVVIDPEAKTEVGKIHVFHDPYEGAEFLTYKRSKQ